MWTGHRMGSFVRQAVRLCMSSSFSGLEGGSDRVGGPVRTSIAHEIVTLSAEKLLYLREHETLRYPQRAHRVKAQREPHASLPMVVEGTLLEDERRGVGSTQALLVLCFLGGRSSLLSPVRIRMNASFPFVESLGRSVSVNEKGLCHCAEGVADRF
jgi:hypothetical protein